MKVLYIYITNMKRAFVYIVVALAVMMIQPVAAQTASDSIEINPLDNIIIRTAVKESMFPEERVYLHFDNTAYYLTETMWFKAYVMSGESNEPTTMSRVLYVELVAPEGYVVQTKKYRIENDGTCHGEFELTPLLLSGYYEVRAYTRYMLNRGKEAIFSRVFPIFDKVNGNNWNFKNMLDRRRHFLVDSEIDNEALGLDRKKDWVESELPVTDLNFYPEGGHLVDGIACNVAFELFGPDGINSNHTITLFADGKKIMEITPEFMGMGTFRITPEYGVKYTANVTVGKKSFKFKLPKVEKEGATISIADRKGNINISIKNNISENAELGCAVIHRGKVRFYERFESADGSMLFVVDKNTLPEGVNRAILFASDSIPLAERMFFVMRDSLIDGDNESARLKITGGNANSVLPHSRISFTVEREDGKCINERGSFSISVSDADYREKTSYTHNIYTYMLLGSEIKGYIPDAARYFDIANNNRTRELELLMMTRGWTAYEWEKLSTRQAKLQQPIEKGIMIKGAFVKKTPVRALWGLGGIKELNVDNLPNKALNFSIMENDSTIYKYGFVTDGAGEFRIHTSDFFGKKVAMLSPLRSTYNHRDSTFSFILDRYFSPEMRLYHYWERNLGMPATEEELKSSGNTEMVKTSSFEYLLSQVEVVSKRKREHNYRPPRSEMRFDFLDEWEYAQDVTYKTNRVDSWSRLYTEHQEYHNFPQGGNHGGDNLSRLDRQVMPQGWLSDNGSYNEIEMGSSFGMNEHGFHINDPAFYNILSAADILRSAFWRHNLDWCYWIQSMVIKGEYSSDSIPHPDEEYLKGISPEKMLRFKEIVIRSDENTRRQFTYGHYDRNIRGKNKGKFNYSSYYNSFLNAMSIQPRQWNNFGIGEQLQYLRNLAANTSYNDIPNYVACFIPDDEEVKKNYITPILSQKSSTRYTTVYGYNESKQFYSPDYSHMKPDSAHNDYRRTLLWNPVAVVKNGKIEIELYNSSSAKNITVDIEGYSDGTFYSNNGSIYNKVLTDEERKRTESYVAGMEIAGINNPDLLVHSFRICEEGRTMFKQGEYEKAFMNFHEAATLGYSDAIFNTAICYLNGKGTEMDSIKAFQYFRRAANLNHVRATHNLASCYMYGFGTKRNSEKALELYKKSATMGLAVSQTVIGNCYLKGSGVEQDSTLAYEWFEKAAADNEPTAQCFIAEKLANIDSTKEMSKRKLRKQPAIEYYQKAAEGGNAYAQYKLARFYETGYYVKKNKKKAFYWYLRAANNYFVPAYEAVAVRYEKGNGTKKNEIQAARWYALALQYGSETARKKVEWYNMFRFFEE